MRYELKLDGTNWKDVSGLVLTDSPFTHNLCGASWKGIADTASFNLRFRDPGLYHEVIEGLIGAQEEGRQVDVKLTEDGVIRFYGHVDLKKLTLSSARLPESIGVSCKDVTTALDEKMTFDAIYDGKSVGEIVEGILRMAGFATNILWDDGIRNEIVEVPFVVTEDDGETYRDALNTLLQEMGGYILRYEHESSSFAVRRVVRPVEAGSTIPVVTYLVPSRLKSTSSLFENDGVVVTYGNVKESEDDEQLVFLQNVSITDGVLKDPAAEVDKDGNVKPSDKDGTVAIPLGDVVPVGGYYPLDSDIQKTFQEYSSDFLQYAYNHNERRTRDSAIGLHYVKPETVSVRIIATDKDNNDLTSWYENVGFYSEEGRFFYPAGGEFHPRKAWQVLHNKSSKCINVKSMAIYGKAVYSDKETRFVLPVDCRDPYEYTAKYICSMERVEALGTLLMNIRKHGGDKTTWTARWSDHQLGDHVYVEHKSASRVLSVVVAKTAKRIGTELWAEYTAVHVGAWEEAADYGMSTTAGSAPGGENDYTRLEDKSENRIIVQYAVIPSDVDFGMGEDLGYGEYDSYGFSADEAYGSEWEWTDGQIDPASALDGYYVWQRTSTDGGRIWRYTRLTGEVGKVFNLKASVSTYEYDRRLISGDNPAIDIIIEKQGYRGEAVVECVTDASYYNASTRKLTIPKTTTHRAVILRAALEGADTQFLTFTGLDKTIYGSYLGIGAAGLVALDGDYYVNPSTKRIEYRTGGEWVPLSEAGLTQAKISEICGTAQRDVLANIPKGTLTESEYGYFQELIVGTVAASYVQVTGAIFGGGFDSEGNNSGTRGFYLGENGYYLIGGFATDGFSSGLSQDIPSVTSQVRQIPYLGRQQNMSCVPSSAFVGRPGLYVYTSGTYTRGDETITASEATPIYLYIRDANMPNGWGSLAYTLSFEDANEPLGYRFIRLYGSDDGKWVTNQGTSVFSANLSGGTARTSIERLAPPTGDSNGRGNVDLTDGRRMYYFGGNVGEQKAAYKEGYFAHMNVLDINTAHRTGSGSFSIFAHSGTSLTSTPDTEIHSESFVSHVYGDGTRYVYAKYGAFRFEAQRLHGVYDFWLMYRPDAEDVSAIENIDAIRIPPIGGLSDDLLSDALDTAVFEVSAFNVEGRGNTGFYAGGLYASVANCSYDMLRGLTMHFYTGYGSSGSRNSINRPVTIHGRFRGLWNK